MSKLFRSVYLSGHAFWLILLFFNNYQAQDIETTLKIDASSQQIVVLEGKLGKESRITGLKNITFRNSYAGFAGLAERFTEVLFYDVNNQPIAAKRFNSAEFVAERDIYGWKYKIDLAPMNNAVSAAHVSWLSDKEGLLMLNDLLPQFASKYGAISARVRLELPTGWKTAGLDKGIVNGTLDSANIENAVIFIGQNWRERDLAIDKFNFKIVISGEWQFADDEVLNLAGEIYRDDRKVFGADPPSSARFFLLKFPQKLSPGAWEAETRGSTVMIVSSDMPFKTQSIQRLHEQLRHEIFHLWMPNGVNFTGNYDWFYEGFALYQSLKTGVMLNRLRFEDLLDTLSRAYTIDSVQNQRGSLLDASKNRWSGANTQVYARGMLTAFLTDLALINQKRTKESVSGLIREVYESGRLPSAQTDGNEAILKIMSLHAELQQIINSYIRGKEKIEWSGELKTFGIESTENNSTTTLKVADKLSGKQKELLDKLGYNNWRKLPADSK